MAAEDLKTKVYNLFKHGYFNGPDDSVTVTDGPDEDIHVVIVSPKLDGLRLREKNDLIWAELVNHLEQPEWGKISLSIGVGPAELKTI